MLSEALLCILLVPLWNQCTNQMIVIFENTVSVKCSQINTIVYVHKFPVHI